MRYKAITLSQPYATLIAIGAKKIETRRWATTYRGPLLIHAAAGLGPVGGKQGLYEITRDEPFRSPILRAGYAGYINLPLGGIVAMCEIVDCLTTRHIKNVKIVRRVNSLSSDYEWLWTEQEKAFGDYTDGRYAWLLADVRPLPEPIPAKGALGLWTWEGELPI